MAYLHEDGKNTFKCERCKRILYWYNFPLPKNQSAPKKYWWQDQPGKKLYKQHICLKCIEVSNIINIKRIIRVATEHNMVGLRERLFDAIDGLRSKTITASEAKAICEVAQVIINTAKVEIEYFKAIGSKKGSSFMEIEGGEKV